MNDRTQRLTVRVAGANLSCIVQDSWSGRQIAETLSTNRTATMHDELNEAGARGYRFRRRPGGRPAFRGREAVVIMIHDARPGKPTVSATSWYHSNETLVDLQAVGLRTYLSEPDRGRRCWQGRPAARDAVYANRRRVRGARGRRLLRCRGELLERPFAHLFETGGMRRVHLRGHPNILKRLLVHVAGCNLGLLLRHLTGVGTPRSLQGRAVARFCALIRRWCDRWGPLGRFWTPLLPTSSRTASSPRHQASRPSHLNVGTSATA